MRNELKRTLNTPQFLESLERLPPKQAEAANKIRNHLLAESLIINEYGVPLLKGTSALDLGLFMLFIEVLDENANTATLAEIFQVGRLSCKNWIGRLREECMCHVEWVKPEIKVRGNVGKFVVFNWGIFQREVYEPFAPYAKIVSDNWKKLNEQDRSEEE